MNITLHLTNKCNLNCRYCYVHKDAQEDMAFDTAKKAVDMALSFSNKHVGISFFGGEPLLMKNLIYKIVDYTKLVKDNASINFSFNMTTNGILLDDKFLKYCFEENIFISISHDGIKEAHDTNRMDKNRNGSYDKLLPNIKKLLSLNPYTPVMQVVNANTVDYFADSVLHLYELGVRVLISTLNFSDNWTHKKLDILKKQYEKISEIYYRKTISEDKFYFSPFDSKINSYLIQGKNAFEECNIGINQVSIAPDGSIYPCVQFVGHKTYIIGSVKTAIDLKKRDWINQKSREEKADCSQCAIKNRCLSQCACLSLQTTGSIISVSPVLCVHERIITPIADKLAEKLYKKRSAMFLHKHYNRHYPAVSLIEDLSGKIID